MVPTISYPATQALELEQDKTREAALSCEFFGLNFNDTTTTTFSSNNVSAFPVIEWDNSESGSDSESVTSIDSWDSFLSSTDYAPPSEKLGKRRRNMSKTTSSTSSSHRRLVRSKKIKSGLASLAMSPTARSA